MNLLDLALIVAALGFAASGYYRGLVVAALSVAGFILGAVVGLWLLPFVVNWVGSDLPRTVVALIVVLVPAILGESIGSRAGWALRKKLTWAPVRWLDGVGGVAANIVAVLLVGWMAGSALANVPSPGLSSQIRESRVLATVDQVMPEQASTWFSRATTALTEAGFPQVFNPFENEPTTNVPAPSSSISAAAIKASRESVVRVVGDARSCGRTFSGSGFVYDHELVMTNAHVVAGVSEPTVQVGGQGRIYQARVVLFDSDTDVAVLSVPGLDAPALDFADDATSGDSAVVSGFPGGGPLDLEPARVASRLRANGQDIYGESVVQRDIYSVRSLVRSGNSGGPLLTPEGEVYGVVFARSVTNTSTGYVLTADEVASEAREGESSDGAVTGTRCAL
ncbi:MarP family serine protease [Flindersiella endophytica]